jgi:Ca2+-binding RTX toxin-like protein
MMHRLRYKIENARGGKANDQIIGNDSANILAGRAGNDRLDGQASADKLRGQKGNDTLNGGSGNDTLKGGQDADTFVFSNGAGPDVVRDFQDNTDILMLTGFTSVAQIAAHAHTSADTTIIDICTTANSRCVA